MFTGKLLLISTVGALIIGFIGGLAVSSLFPSAQLGGGLSQAQIEKVKMMFPPTHEMRAFSGTVKQVDSTTLTLEIAESPNPFDEWPTTRKVTVSDTTKIIKLSQKDPKEYQKEMEAYSASGVGRDPKNPAAYLPPPNPSKEEILKLSDIKSGDVITVEADHDIKSEAQFTATKITLGTSGPAGFDGPPGRPPAGTGNLPIPSPAGSYPTPTSVPAPR